MEALPEQGVVPVTRISDVTRDKDGILRIPVTSVAPSHDGIVVLAPEEPEHVTSLTPSGLEVYYSWAPRRHYKIRRVASEKYAHIVGAEWVEVPSVTNVLNVLEKPALTWWGQSVGVEGVMELTRRGILVYGDGHWTDSFNGLVDKDDVVRFLTQEKLTTNHVKDAASTRGLSVHSAFESWASDTSFRPTPSDYPETEQGYIRGLNLFLDEFVEVGGIEAEIMVGSIVHGFAGRYDLRLGLVEDTELTTRVYPKRAPKREVVPSGRLLIDLKTSKKCYPSHALQLAAYELASVECGYGATDARYVLHVTADGQYEFVRCNARAEDFLSVLSTHKTMQGAKGWL